MTDKQLEALRSRWRRWLGQKMRYPYMMDLLDCNYSGWPRQVLEEAYDSVKDPWKEAINQANYNQLSSLDIINLDFNEKKRQNR